MDLRNRRGLKYAAGEALAQAPRDPKRVIWIHTAVSVGIVLLVAIMDYVLSAQIENTGGLSGLGTRSVLTTVQSLLQMVQLAVLPFWEIGYLYASMKLYRREPTEPTDLMEGFRKFGPFLRAMLLRMVILVLLALICTYVATQIFLLTPLSDSMTEAMMPFLNDFSALDTVAGEEAMMAAMEQAMEAAMVPLLALTGLVLSLVYIPIFYRLRLVNYSLLEHPKEGAWMAFRRSSWMMRGNCVKMFQLDLSFWWYYLLQGILTVICYGDVLLSLVGISLPWSGEVGFFVFYVLSLAGQFALYLFARNRVAVTYAAAYQALVEAHTNR